MTYIHITRTPGETLEGYQAIADRLGPVGADDGRLFHAVARDDQGLHIVDVWESKAHADRFAAERLFPAFAASGRTEQAMAETEIRAFEAALVESDVLA